jgi:hypothetical protein
MRKEEIIKLSIIIILALAVISITGCQSPVVSSIEITSPESMEKLDGNGTYEIEWIWTGPDKEINLMLVGYNVDEEEIGMMPIDSMIQASSGSYTWGPNFGESIFLNFGSGENWPWWFKIEADVPDTDIWDASGFFSVQWTQ